MAKVIKTEIRMDNVNDVTYVLKKFNNDTYKLYQYNKNKTSGCYYLVFVKNGICG